MRPILTIAVLLLTPSALYAQDADELARQTQNPVANLVSLPFQANWDFGIGEREAVGGLLNIQPVAPFSLTTNWNAILRVIMPIVSQPVEPAVFDPLDIGARLNGISDVLTTVFISPADPGALIWGIGPAMLLPTATNNLLGSEQFGLGPSVVALVQPGPWTVGILFNQIWSVDGAIDREDVNQAFFQPFLNYNFGAGLSAGVSAESTAAWDQDETWSTVVVFNVSKVATLGKQHMSFTAGAGPFVGPDDSPDWRLRLVATFLFPTLPPTTAPGP